MALIGRGRDLVSNKTKDFLNPEAESEARSEAVLARAGLPSNTEPADLL